ncbi:MAG: lipase [Deltaproteobacteria bacterium]|nr:lipase [Deltaproteobacteria bacterium]
MNMKWLVGLTLGTSLAATGCPSIDRDPGEGEPLPTVEFDPANKIVPFPNNLLLDPATGKVNLPAQCNESPTSKALREGVLNTLDGFGTFETAINVTFTEPVDQASLTGNVLVFKRTNAAGTLNIDPKTAQPLPVVFIPNTTTRFDASCANPLTVNQITIIPRVPLDQKSTYVVAVLDGVKTASGAPFNPSFTWGLVRSSTAVVKFDAKGNVTTNRTPLDPADPAQLAQLQGIDLLWKAHARGVSFLAAAGHPNTSLLLMWEFNTQTVTDALDSTVAGTPAASSLTTPPLVGVSRVNAAANGEAFLNAVLPNQCQNQGGPLPCQNVGEVLKAGLLGKQYQIDTPNPLTGGSPVPGPWGDPIKPAVVHDPALGGGAGGGAPIGVLIATPITAICASNCPTVVFGHALGSSKTTVFAIASQLASAGFNAVAIDEVAHDSRAVRVSDDAAKGCAGTPTPATAPQCFAAFLSTNLAAARDNIRQSIIDHQSLIAALKGCGSSNCGLLSADPAKIVYMGLSLGGITGSAVTATSDIKAAALNVPAVGWIDIVENTQSLAIRCSVVDGLIDAGILIGDKFEPNPGVGLCLGEEWKLQPGYRQFSVIGRWILDPADPANFNQRLASKRILIQEVVGDQVFPNLATDNAAALVGLAGMTADPAASPTPPPSAAIGITNVFVKYPTLPADAGSGFPGNTFDHASLLRPTPESGVAGQLGTIRLQTDAITFLVLNR